MIMFGIMQLILSQILDFDQLWWLSIVVVVMSFSYSSIGLGLCIGKVAGSVKQDFRSIDILVHSLSSGPEVSKPLLETSRKQHLAAVLTLIYSFVLLLKHFIPIMNPSGLTISLTYIASESIILRFIYFFPRKEA